MRYILPCILAIAGTLAAPTLDKRLVAPKVTIQNGTVVGSTTGIIDTFNGIPFAQPPVGNLRLKPPQSLKSGFASGTINAVGVPTSCPQFYSQINTTDLPSNVLGLLTNSPLFQKVSVQGEDCLTLNVQRPANVSPTSKLPVVAWIFGGGTLLLHAREVYQTLNSSQALNLATLSYTMVLPSSIHH